MDETKVLKAVSYNSRPLYPRIHCFATSHVTEMITHLEEVEIMERITDCGIKVFNSLRMVDFITGD